MKIFISLLFIFLLATSDPAQNQKNLTTAAVRAQKSVEIVNQFAALGADSVPFEYLQKAKAVAVFLGLTKVNILLSELIIGNGMVAVRNGSKWETPVFLAFKGTDINFGIARKKSFDTVFLFMDDESVEWLKKGDFGFNTDSKGKVMLGPVIGGTGADATIDQANLIYYTFDKGQLIDTNLSNDSAFKGFAIFHDNNLNKSVFGMKTKALFSAPEASIKVPAEIEKFRMTLIEISSKTTPRSGENELIKE